MGLRKSDDDVCVRKGCGLLRGEHCNGCGCLKFLDYKSPHDKCAFCSIKRSEHKEYVNNSSYKHRFQMFLPSNWQDPEDLCDADD